MAVISGGVCPHLPACIPAPLIPAHFVPAVSGFNTDQTPSHLLFLTDASDQAIRTWKKIYLSGGIEALLKERRGGSQKVIEETGQERIAARLADTSNGFTSFGQPRHGSMKILACRWTTMRSAFHHGAAALQWRDVQPVDGEFQQESGAGSFCYRGFCESKASAASRLRASQAHQPTFRHSTACLASNWYYTH